MSRSKSKLDASSRGTGGRLSPRLAKMHLEFQLENDPSLLAPLVEYVTRRAARLCEFSVREKHGLAVAFCEALANALYHGNLELSSEALHAGRMAGETGSAQLVAERRRLAPFRQRKIHVQAELSPAATVLTIADEGPGFDPARVPDPTGDDALLHEYGRGILLMRFYMDEVRYSPTGNVVTLIKRRLERQDAGSAVLQIFS